MGHLYWHLHDLLIKQVKHVRSSHLFNKHVVFGLRIPDMFTKQVGFESTHIVEYWWLDMTRTQPTNTNCHPSKISRLVVIEAKWQSRDSLCNFVWIFVIFWFSCGYLCICISCGENFEDWLLSSRQDFSLLLLPLCFFFFFFFNIWNTPSHTFFTLSEMLLSIQSSMRFPYTCWESLQ